MNITRMAAGRAEKARLLRLVSNVCKPSIEKCFMKKNYFLAVFVLCGALLCGGTGTALAQGDEASGSDMVSCADGMLRIDAANVKAEDLIRDIGDKCGIKIVVFGEAFDEKPIGVKFQQQPMRKGIQRVLRVANMSNFVLHFDNNTASPRIVELDIMGKKGGERQLTSGTGRPVSSPAPVPVPSPGSPAPAPAKAAEKAVAGEKRDDKKAPPADPKEIVSDKTQQEFMKVMDEMMKAQEAGEEPDPAEVLRIFKEVVPPEIRSQIPPDVLKEIEDFEKNPPKPPSGVPSGGVPPKKK